MTLTPITGATPSADAPLGVSILGPRSLRHALPAGSRILTARGEVLVEALRPGDRVVTRDRGMVPIRRVVRMPAPQGTPMVLIPAGALGRAKPERDVTLPLDQPIALRDWRARVVFQAREARVAVGRLIDGRIVRIVPGDVGSVWSLILDAPSVLYVDGLNLVSAGADALPD